jgi:hypothetical protein
MQVHRHYWRREERVARLCQEQIAIWRIVGIEPVAITPNVGNCARQIKERKAFTVGTERRRICANECRERSEDPRLFGGDRRLRLSDGVSELNNL